MKRISIIILQVVIVLIGIVALSIMIWFPLTEGRADHLDLFSIYADAFIVYGYASSIAFFVALYKALYCNQLTFWNTKMTNRIQRTANTWEGHAGFSGFRAFGARKKDRCNLIRIRLEIPIGTIPSTVGQQCIAN